MHERCHGRLISLSKYSIAADIAANAMQQQFIPLCWCYWCIVKKLITHSLTHSLTPESWRYFDSKSITMLSPEPFFFLLKYTPNRSAVGKGREGKGRERKGKEGKGREWKLPPLKFKSGYALVYVHYLWFRYGIFHFWWHGVLQSGYLVFGLTDLQASKFVFEMSPLSTTRGHIYKLF